MPLWQGRKNRKNQEGESTRPGRKYDDFLYDDMSDLTGSYHSFATDDGAEMKRPEKRESSPFLQEEEAPARKMDDYGYPTREDEPEEAGESAENGDDSAEDEGGSLTPEEAMARMKAAREEESGDRGDSMLRRMRQRRGGDAEPPVKKSIDTPKAPRRLRRLGVVIITLLITGVLAAMFLSNIVETEWLQQTLSLPETGVAAVMSPIQTFFTSITETVADYFRTLKLRDTLETEYNNLRAENEQLVYQAMLAEELQIQLQQYEEMYTEVEANRDMNPIVCTVIGRDDGNYFSTFTINKGSRDGIEDYMAVTISGALVGYTENVQETSCTVRTIIDSEASIAALIQSSRDQGIVSGTLGIDGQAMCRMYYTSDDTLPRPGDTVVTSGVGMSFPKGIPIGTVRESTRGMESNKSYIVVEPTVDFEHIEYVIVLRYQPEARAVTGRTSTTDYSNFVALETARPYPTLRIGGTSLFATPAPADLDEEAPTPDITSTPAPTDTPEPEATDTPEPTPEEEVLEYHAVSGTATPSPEPTPEPTPSPTPYVTLNPDDLTYEED